MKYLNQKTNLISWLKVMRISQGFFIISTIPVILANFLLIFHYPELKNWSLLNAFLILIITLLFHLGADMINEYYDFKRGNHQEVTIKTPFNGGTRILEEGKLEAKQVLKTAYLFFFLGSLISLVLAFLTSFLVLIFAFLGLFSSWSYSAPPLKLAYRGLGELLIFLNNGLFIISLVFLVYLPHLPILIILLPSIILGFLGLSVILTNEIPDYFPDKRVNKKNIVVRFGKKKALVFIKLSFVFSLLSLLLSIQLNIIPYEGLLAVIPFLKRRNIFKIQLNNFEKEKLLFNTCKSVLSLKLEVGTFLILAFIIHFFYN